MKPVTPARLRALTIAGLLASGAIPALAADPVLLDLFRGNAYVPAPVQTPNYNNNVAPGTPANRYDGVKRLIDFGSTDSNRATPIAGTTLPSSWPNLEVPEFDNADVLCEYPGGTNNACKNSIQGAFVYTALLMPAAGNYQFNCTGNDGAILGVAAAQGTDYRALGYPDEAALCGASGGGLPTAASLNSPASNTLVNVRVAWNNWGNGAELRILWVPPGSTTAVTIPAASLFDPSDPATYLAADNDDFSATPLTAGAAGTTASVFGNDRVNVATPVTAGAGGNIQTWALVNDPVTGTPPPTGITLNADGTLAVEATMAPGSYSVSYQICRTDTQPQPLCATAHATLQVDADIAPTADVAPATLPAGTPGTPIDNVAGNDTVNGQPATLGTGGNATVTPAGSWPAGVTLDPDSGAVHVASTVPPGPYNLSYTLCDTGGNCADSDIRFTLTAAVLVAGPDSGSATAGSDSTPIPNVTGNDTVNGQPAQLGAGGNATVTPTGTWPAGITLDPATGAVQVAASMPAGTHDLTYTLCPVNGDPCTTGTITLELQAVATGVAAVPTLGEWSLMLLGLLAAGLGARGLRRRRT